MALESNGKVINVEKLLLTKIVKQLDETIQHQQGSVLISELETARQRK